MSYPYRRHDLLRTRLRLLWCKVRSAGAWRRGNVCEVCNFAVVKVRLFEVDRVDTEVYLPLRGDLVRACVCGVVPVFISLYESS